MQTLELTGSYGSVVIDRATGAILSGTTTPASAGWVETGDSGDQPNVPPEYAGARYFVDHLPAGSASSFVPTWDMLNAGSIRADGTWEPAAWVFVAKFATTFELYDDRWGFLFGPPPVELELELEREPTIEELCAILHIVADPRKDPRHADA